MSLKTQLSRPRPGSYFSIDVAKLVTQPFCKNRHQLQLRDARCRATTAATAARCTNNVQPRTRKLTWPSRVPLRMSCSAILETFLPLLGVQRIGGKNGELFPLGDGIRRRSSGS